MSTLADQRLEEVPQSHLKWPRGGIYKHVSISPTVNNGKGHSGVGGGRPRGGFIVSGTLTRTVSLTHTHIQLVRDVGWVGGRGGHDYTGHENNKYRRLLKVSKQRKYWDKHGLRDRIH